MKKTALALMLSLTAAMTYAQFVPQSALENSTVKTYEHKNHEHKAQFEGKFDGEGKGGFQKEAHAPKEGKRPPEPKIVTVSEQNTWKDDQRVALQGKIVEQYDEDDFLFQDNTGTIKIEVKNRAWQGQTVTPNTEIKIFGEVDKDHNKIEIEVHHIEIVK